MAKVSSITSFITGTVFNSVIIRTVNKLLVKLRLIVSLPKYGTAYEPEIHLTLSNTKSPEV